MWLHVLLFALTALTTTIVGSSFSEIGSLEDIAKRPWLLLLGWPYALCLLLILGSHEMGHYLACRYYGIPATLPFFIPGLPFPAFPPFGTFGAVIRIRGVIPNRKALFDVAAAGPLAGFAVALPILVAGLLQAEPIHGPVEAHGEFLGSPLLSSLLERLLYGDAELRVGALYCAGWVGMLVTSLNLFPVGQLDGGHAVYALSRHLHRRTSRWTIAGMLAFVLYQAITLSTAPAYAVWLVVLLFMRDRHPMLAEESIPLDRGRRLVALLLLLMFLATFIPIPLVML